MDKFLINSKLQCPAPISGNNCYGFANHSIVVRLVDILRQLVNVSSVEQSKIQNIIDDIQNNSTLTLITSGPDIEMFNDTITKSELTLTWLSAPWIFVEGYFYRRIFDNINYFTNFIDPFHYSKNEQLISSLSPTNKLALAVLNFIEAPTNKQLPQDLFYYLMNECLWGNKADLSFNPSGSKNDSDKHLDEEENIIINSSDDVYQLLSSIISNKKNPKIEFIVDNVGLDIISDLMIATIFTYLCNNDSDNNNTKNKEESKNKKSDKPNCIIHLKAQPIFVSDVTCSDFEHMLNVFQSKEYENEFPNLKKISTIWKDYIDNNYWNVRSNGFWNSPEPFWNMPNEIKVEMESSDLILFKGDANSRRLHGDLQWSFDSSTKDIIEYLSFTNVLLVRTLKSETASGLESKKIESLSNNYPNYNWLSSGKFGVIQLLKSGH